MTNTRDKVTGGQGFWDTASAEHTDTHADVTAHDDAWIGKVIADQFRVTRCLGAGGMGGVFLADQIGMDRQVVIKAILPNLRHDPDIVARFGREARTISRLRHPNIVQVFMTGKTDDGALFLAMEYVPGRTLAEEIEAEGAMSEARVLGIGRQIASAMASADEAGVVHRDLKPQNVMLSPMPGNSDHVVVLDFGIAKVLHQDTEAQTRLTQTGVMMGTPLYMSPEQIHAGDVDGRTDIYALGIMLYEMVTGTVPFRGRTPLECLMQHLKEPPPSPSGRFPSLKLSRSFEHLMNSCLEKHPDDRMGSAVELIRVFDVVAQGGVFVHEFDAEPEAEPRALTPTLALVALLVVLLAGGAIAAVTIIGGTEAANSTQATDEPSVVVEPLTEPENQSTDGSGHVAQNQPIGAPSIPEATGPDATEAPDGSLAAATEIDPETPNGALEAAVPQPQEVAQDQTQSGHDTTVLAELHPVAQVGDPGEAPSRQPPALQIPDINLVRPPPNPRLTPIQRSFSPPPQPLQPAVPIRQPATPIGQPNVAPPAPVAASVPTMAFNGPRGAPLVDPARFRSQVGSMTSYATTASWADVSNVYAGHFAGQNCMISAADDGQMSIIDNHDQFSEFHMISLRVEGADVVITYFAD